MKRTAPTIALLLIAAMLGGALALAAAAAFADDETPATVMVTIRMLATRAMECKEKGGCAFLTRAEMAALYEKGKTEGRMDTPDSLDFHGCRVDRT